MLFRYQGHIGTYLIMGGVDVTGPHLYEIAAHGSTSKVPYCTMGSGSNVDLVVIKEKDDVKYLRGFDEANVKGVRRQKYTYKKGTTGVLSEKVRNIKLGGKGGEGSQFVIESE